MQNDIPEDMRLKQGEVYVWKNIDGGNSELFIYSLRESNRIMLEWCGYNSRCSPMDVELCGGGRIKSLCYKCSIIGKGCHANKPYGDWHWGVELPNGDYTFKGRVV